MEQIVNNIIAEKDAIIMEKDAIIEQDAVIIMEKDAIIAQLLKQLTHASQSASPMSHHPTDFWPSATPPPLAPSFFDSFFDSDLNEEKVDKPEKDVAQKKQT